MCTQIKEYKAQFLLGILIFPQNIHKFKFDFIVMLTNFVSITRIKAAVVAGEG